MAAIRIRKWGNSAALRLSAAILEEAQLAIDQEVEIVSSPGRIVIETCVPVYALEDMLATVTLTNVPDFRPSTRPAGTEVFEW
jgi:antitoxin MazE